MAGKAKTKKKADGVWASYRVASYNLVGMTPLMVHRFSEKAKQEMRDKFMKKARGTKEARNPEEEYLAARYVENGQDCFRAIGIKKAIVSAARYVDDFAMTELRGALFVRGDLLPIYDHKDKKTYGADHMPAMSEDTVVISGGTTTLRYRPRYNDWSIGIEVEYNAKFLSLEQLTQLIEIAGFSVGIAEDRPEKKGGQLGRWRVKGVKDLGEMEDPDELAG